MKKKIILGAVVGLVLVGVLAAVFRKKPSEALQYQEVKVARGDLQSKPFFFDLIE